VRKAQSALLGKLQNDVQDPEFRARYSAPEARRKLSHDDLGVQLHRYKIDPEIVSVLEQSGLGWKPTKYEPTDPDGQNYIEVHERVGEAIMSVIAIACAEHHNANIVAEPRSEALHRCLVERRLREVYDAWLHPDLYLDPPMNQSGERVFDFMLEWACDINSLAASDIAELGEDRAAIDALLTELQRQAGTIRLDPGPDLDEALQQLISEVLKTWQQERSQLARFGKELLGGGLLKPGTEFLTKVTEKAVVPAAAAGAATVTTGAIVGSLTMGGLIGAAAGLAIGVTAHVGTAYIEAHRKGRTSPLRYITALTNAGVKIEVPVKTRSIINPDIAARNSW
jgi:uncharacterized protein with von Willebrand factor type A (vWA) domain